MSKVRVIEVHENVFNANNLAADELRERLSEKKVTMLNVMSSPGSGKTTLLSDAINRIKDQYKTGVPSIQIHNGGLCHIDAEMTTRAIDEFGVDDFDFLFLENIGNLVCPAEFDTGSHKNLMILSVPEGDDKPLKYPLMFSVCDLVLISKMDTLDYFDFDIEKAKENIKNLNPNATILCVSAKSGEGMDEFVDWLKEAINN